MSRINTTFDTYYEISDGGFNRMVSFTRDAKQSEEAFAREFFTAVSHDLCFSDCSNIDVLRIVFMGWPIEYAGWQQGMKFTFTRPDKSVAWEGVFPHWDH